MELTGLNSQEVNERVSKGLLNKSAQTKSKKLREIFLENIFSLFNIIIFSIILFLLFFYFRSSDRRLLYDSIGVLTVAIVNTLIAIIQEIRAKRALDKVSLLLKRETTVIRNGEHVTIDQSDVVVDDLVIVERGDQVVVDGKVIQSNHMEIDESLLTGESQPIFKNENDKILSGSFCVSGNGIYEAEKVGDNSYAAEITKLAKTFKLNLSPLQKKINFIVKTLFAAAIILVALEIIFRGGNFSDTDFIRKLATILLSLVPQGLVLMSSVTFALGIYRISKIGAIVQKLNAIESFSNVKVVCTDKTGTLTKNKLSVNRITLLNDKYELDYVQKLLGTYGKLSSDKNATLRTLEIYNQIDDTELIDEIPFSSEYKRSLLQLKIKNEELRIVLGGFDILVEKVEKYFIDSCTNEFNKNKLSIYRNILFGLEKSGKSLNEVRNNLDDIIIEPICILSISDEVRDDVMEAINLFKENDIQVKILSGDAANSIQAVAKEIGWDVNDDELITGTQLDGVKDEDLSNTILTKSIFARLKPEHKLRIIKSLKRDKIYNTMIGDGVNDLPAIKESDMGIAMEDGSKITREVADIVLLKNKFTLLPKIFQEGNKIVNTVSAVSKLFLTKNFMVIYLALFSLLFFFEFHLTPRRISLINIFSIGLPALVIAIKNENTEKYKNFMIDLFSFVTISAIVIVGATYAGEFYVQNHFNYLRHDLQMVMMSIMTIVTVSNFLSIVIRKKEKNIKLYMFYSAIILLLFIFLAVTDIDFHLLNLVKRFYEIRYLAPEYWSVVLLISFAGSTILFILQKLREIIISKIKK